MSAQATPDEVIGFWLEAGPARWFAKDDDFDRSIAERFADLHERASGGALDHWADTPEGALALLLVLDQFSRNLFRRSPRMFDQDAAAREIARSALASGAPAQVRPELQAFFYLPFMHSESHPDQELCVKLCHGLPDRGTLPYARDHERIIRRFGRFPHRNAVLGRHTSPAEQAFLDAGGFAG